MRHTIGRHAPHPTRHVYLTNTLPARLTPLTTFTCPHSKADLSTHRASSSASRFHQCGN